MHGRQELKHEGNFPASPIVLSFEHTLTKGSGVIQGRPESALYTTVKWRRKDFVQVWWSFISEMHEDKTRVTAVFLLQQQVVNSLEECSSRGILHKRDLLLYHLFAPRHAEWSRSLTIAVKHSDIVATVDLKWTEESLTFFGDVMQEEGDIIKARNDIGSIAALARVVQGCCGLSACSTLNIDDS